jgi:CRISPR-associated endonuclease/helicase Cas3
MWIFHASEEQIMKFQQLLAKSMPVNQKPGAATYVGHISAVMDAADALIDKLGASMIAHLNLDTGLEQFANTVRLGAYLHDWGKANQHFQIMVRLKDLRACKSESEKSQQLKLQNEWKKINKRQMLRHEVISGILALQVPGFRAWLEQCPNVDLVTAVWAAMGHHLKLGGKQGKALHEIASIPDGTGNKLEIYTDHKQFQALLKMGVQRLRLPESLPEIPSRIWTKDELSEALEEGLLEEFIDYADEIERDSDRQRLIAAVKATVIVADIAGSALPNVEGHAIKPWINEALDLILTKSDLQTVLTQRLGTNELRSFQKLIAQTNCRVTVVKAGCGTGKTIGAYAWAMEYAKEYPHIDRLFFCYPTTGTASQGYLDYAHPTSVESLLMHSRARIDLEQILFSYEGEHEQNPDDEEDAERIDARLSSFRAWQAKLIVCTVDSVLGLIQNNRKPLYAWPAICQSAFVFDEVHAFDDKLFGALLRFIKTFRGAPILLMSASFTDSQLKAICKVMSELEEPINEIEGPEELETLDRYIIEQNDNIDDIWQQTLTTLKNEQKVLWVTNTVNDCIETFYDALNHLRALGIKPLIYHSRFRYADRVGKHRKVIEAFQSDQPVLAVTTQVCEMSLDLSCDLLVSALAPAAALIQRLGRLNRRKVTDDGKICPALIFPWTKKNPYKPDELETGQQLIDLLPSGAVSQRDLAKAASKLGSNQPESGISNWLDGHWRSYPGALREAGYTITVLLEQDIPVIKKEARKKGNSFGAEAQGWSVPIPLIKGYAQWQREGVYLVAPAHIIKYSPETGVEICR